MGKQHEDIKYLMQEDIGGILCKGLAETVDAQPKNPVEFFAKWLLNYKKSEVTFAQEIDQGAQVLKMRREHEAAKRAKEEEAVKKEKEAEAKKQEDEKFWKELEESPDPNDNLTALANYIQTNIKATGVYIGKLEAKMQPIKDDDDDKAHMVEEAPLVIKFKHANVDHEGVMNGKVLEPEQGLCHELFKDDAGGEEEAEEKGSNAEEEADAGESDDILKKFKHKYVKEVVREPKIHFWQVPRLGSFMAVPMIYKSCLFEEAIDKALLDWAEIKKLREEQDKERGEWEEGEREKKEAAEKAGENYVPEQRSWQEINPAPFETVEEKFVVCIDTLGQDRELTDDQKRLVLQTVEKYRNTWEQRENSMLEKDRDDRLKTSEADKLW